MKLIALLTLLLLPIQPAAAHPSHRRAPNFTLRDRAGKTHTLLSYRGRPVTLFFLCGCTHCTELARQWAEWQNGGVLVHTTTIVIFAGEAQYADGRISASGLATNQTTILGDPDLRVTRALYHAPTCPRVFVLDAHGIVRYTNNHTDDAPQKAPALLIASRTLAALRRSAPKHP
jgi:peroxiredoxin